MTSTNITLLKSLNERRKYLIHQRKELSVHVFILNDELQVESFNKICDELKSVKREIYSLIEKL